MVVVNIPNNALKMLSGGRPIVFWPSKNACQWFVRYLCAVCCGVDICQAFSLFKEASCQMKEGEEG